MSIESSKYDDYDDEFKKIMLSNGFDDNETSLDFSELDLDNNLHLEDLDKNTIDNMRSDIEDTIRTFIENIIAEEALKWEYIFIHIVRIGADYTTGIYATNSIDRIELTKILDTPEAIHEVEQFFKEINLIQLSKDQEGLTEIQVIVKNTGQTAISFYIDEMLQSIFVKFIEDGGTVEDFPVQTGFVHEKWLSKIIKEYPTMIRTIFG